MRPIKLATLTAACAALTLPVGPAASQDADPPPAEQPMTNAELTSFIEGNIYFLAYHELGHAFISEFELSPLGREEDAVDRLATWMMTPDDPKDEPEYLMATLLGWFSLSAKKSLDQIKWWDEHGTDGQRGYQVACLLYGYNPPAYKSIADAVDLPPARRQSCAKEAKQNEKSWTTTLKPYYRSDRADDVAPPDSVTLTYAPSQDYVRERGFLMNSGVLEEIRRLITEEYQFKPGITLSAEDCGEPNAFWRPSERKLTICYELVREFRRLGDPPQQPAAN